ncbi:RAMP superfamily CRISPR-associated protein [Thermodesulfatator autotrophicus]|uniref:CRISPR type III-associated protein domain-containing protein n=1 Tax=Thermodesulfatator autotrophicus TaxID=1795632 RepID=A0A177EAK3_9BACT|nr:RAMP superfamily CRISPR-associated protein [Thermodesulfatator autotrophicus]OAG28551.1 hypothetical protein TH606_00930 [Thermodesulfatator autotrophicus]
MKREFWAHFDLYEPFAQKGINIRNEQNNRQKRRIQQQARSEIEQFIFQGCIGHQVVRDCAARLSHLAQLLAVDCVCEGRTTQCKDYAKGKNGLQRWYYAGDLESPRGDYQTFLCQRLRWMGQILGLANHHETVSPSFPDLALFPPGAWAMQVHFTLRKPYISKDDVDFYILDNPVKKEWVFKVPYVAPSQWKGALRAAMMRMLVDDLRSGQKNETEFVQERLRLYRLFGNEKDGTAEFLNRALTLHLVGPRPEDEEQAKEWEKRYKQTYEQMAREFEERVRSEGYRKDNVEGFQGALHFYPTFFDRIGLEVINPHDRKTGAGKNPIYFECVPAGTQGVFTLLYVPLDADEETTKSDLEAVVKGIRSMLTQYGFGAKTSSGYGVAEDELITGVVKTNVPGWFKTTSTPRTADLEPPEEAFLKYLDDETGEVKGAFKGSGKGGLFSNSEYKQHGASLGGGSLGEFKRFRAWYVKHGARWKASRMERASEEPASVAGLEKDFHSLSELSEIAHALANEGGDHA